MYKTIKPSYHSLLQMITSKASRLELFKLCIEKVNAGSDTALTLTLLSLGCAEGIAVETGQAVLTVEASGVENTLQALTSNPAMMRKYHGHKYAGISFTGG